MQVVEGQVILAKPTQAIRLRSIKDVRKEMASVYADARCGRIPSQDATRLVYCLVALSNTIRDHEIEQRIEKLEEQSNK